MLVAKIPLFSLIIFSSLSPILSQTCQSGRLTQYPIYSSNKIPQGTCSFGPVYSQMPEEFKQGRIIAANQDFYNRLKTQPTFTNTCTPQSGVSCGQNCGECVLVTGAKGSATYIIGDICDSPTVGQQCAGDMTQFDLNNLNLTDLKLVADSPGMEMMSFKPVPCSTNGNIRMYFPATWSNKWSVNLFFFNYKYPLQKVEILATGNPAKVSNWISLPRDWVNNFEWRGTSNYTGQSGDIYNGGNGFLVRLTSIYGEVLESSITLAIPATNITQNIFDLGIQFSKSNITNPTEPCLWPGPTADIYKDTIINRKSDGLGYSNCIFGSTGCRTFFSGQFLMEWWLTTQYNLINMTLDYTGAECTTVYCISVPKVNGWGGIIIGFSSSFLNSTYKAVNLMVKLGKMSSLTTYGFTVGFDNCQKQIGITGVTNVWKSYKVLIADMNCTTYIKTFRMNFNPGDGIFVDNIYLSN